MAINDQVSQEYLYIKCFLYKYTPDFIAKDGVTSTLSTFKPYSIDLNNVKYFTKYDISPFVGSYSFEQRIDETTYSWSLELLDQALSYATLNKLKVLPPEGNPMRGGLAFSNSSNSAFLLSKYETNATNINNNNLSVSSLANLTNPILSAKQKRGATPGPLTAQNTNLTEVLSTVPGLRLSDLIQEYDFISVFLYKNQTPLTSIWGVFTTDESIPNNPIRIFNYKTTSDVKPAFQNVENPLDANLKYESVLLTQMPNGQSLFSNEFNGFIIKKSAISSINQVDRLTISGNGWSRLFGSTRRTMKPSLFQNSLYEAGQVLGAADVSAFENVYAGRSIAQIIRDLFDLVYRIDFNTTSNTFVTGVTQPVNFRNSTNLLSSTQNQDQFFASPLSVTGTTNTEAFYRAKTSEQLILLNSFFNTTSLIVANSYPANLFNLPQYLLASVMKLRPFAYIEPLNMPVSADFLFAARASAATEATIGAQPGQEQSTDQVALSTNLSSIKVPPETFQKAMQNFSPSDQVLNYDSAKPVFVEPDLQNLVAYFQFLSDVFQPFSPDLKTPYEVLDQIRSQAFVEIYEQPSGQFIIRSPQYNNFSTSVPDRPDIKMIRSNNLNIMSSSYSSTVENLVTKLFAGYSPNITPISVFQQFGYCDGKLLIQNGLLETTTSANPNAATASLTNSNTNNSKTTGIFGYAEYLMILSNAKLKIGTLSCDLDNSIQVGQTVIDETRFKFGYIVGVTKQVSVAGTATMNLSLSYVRDAVPTYSNTGEITRINVDLLPVLTQIEQSFAPPVQ